MADTLKRLSGPTLLTAAAATLYTAPASTITSVRSIHIANESAATATCTISIGADGPGKRLFYQVPVYVGDVLDWAGLVVLAAGEALQAYSGTASALTLTVSGIETA